MTVTIPYVKNEFNEFNRMMFGGKLVMPAIELSKTRTFVGMCVYKKRKRLFRITENNDFLLAFQHNV